MIENQSGRRRRRRRRDGTRAERLFRQSSQNCFPLHVSPIHARVPSISHVQHVLSFARQGARHGLQIRVHDSLDTRGKRRYPSHSLPDVCKLALRESKQQRGGCYGGGDVGWVQFSKTCSSLEMSNGRAINGWPVSKSIWSKMDRPRLNHN